MPDFPAPLGNVTPGAPARAGGTAVTDGAPTFAVDPVDSRVFRSVMGRFPSGVTVVTAPDTSVPDNAASDSTGAVHGMTASGFLSVSVDPPLILVSVARTSRMVDRLRRAGRYGVSMLADDRRRIPGTSPGVRGPARGRSSSGTREFCRCAGPSPTSPARCATPTARGITSCSSATSATSRTDGEPLVF